MTKRITSKKPVTFNCMTFEQADHKLVLFFASAKQLWSITQVNQREEDSDKGYQRAVSSSRAKKIAQFIDTNNLIPTSVLISFEYAKLSRNDTQLTVQNRKDAGWIIDGQHRLAGADVSNKDIVLPVVAFTDLDVAEQIKCFVTINREQRGVSSSLYLELLKNIPGSRDATQEAKERTVDIAHLMRRDESSPFFGRIVSTTSPKAGELSLTNFVRKVHPMIKRGGRLEIFNDEERCGIINNYYKGLKQAFPQQYNHAQSIFFKTIGFGALMGVLPTFIDLTLHERKSFKVADTSNMFKRLQHFDFAQWRGLTGSGAEKVAADGLREELLEYGRDNSSSGTIEL